MDLIYAEISFAQALIVFVLHVPDEELREWKRSDWHWKNTTQIAAAALNNDITARRRYCTRLLIHRKDAPRTTFTPRLIG